MNICYVYEVSMNGDTEEDIKVKRYKTKKENNYYFVVKVRLTEIIE